VGNSIAVLLIALIMVAALRNFKLGTLSLIPNVLPILITYGIWTLLVGHIGMASATVSATSLGIIVDDSVHFLTKYLRARREYGYSQPESISYVFHTVGNALVANSVILVSGFAFLALSTFKVNLEMGLLTAIAILVALVFDFLILPALLLVGHQSTNKGEIYDEISHDNKYAIQAVK
jgi:predicted RND superfamily exporter protein